MADYTKVPIIDALPDIQYDEAELSKWLIEQRTGMVSDRDQWMTRHRRYLGAWDDYITFQRDGPWDNSANFHVPLTMQVVKAVHARFKGAILGVRPWWQLIPLEKLDQERVKTIDTVMKWAVQNYVNCNKGIETALDDWIWDFCTIGWGVMGRRWATLQRKSIIIEDVKKNQEEIGDQLDMLTAKMEEAGGEVAEEGFEVVGKEVEKILTYFDGPMCEPLPHEDVLFPAVFNDVSDLNQPFLVCNDFRATKGDLIYGKETEFYKGEAVNGILENSAVKPGQYNTEDSAKDDYKRAQDRFHGVKTSDARAGVDEYRLSKMFFRYDIDGGGVPQELVATVDLKSHKILRLTHLDRITKTGKRPLHKIDFIRRPRRAYSLGLLELLYPINEELDAMHNMRVDYGTLSNIPFFFYRATSGMKPEKIRLEPGMGHPLDDPNNDVNFPRFQNSTSWGFQEEASLVSWAEKLSSVTAMNMGLPSERVGASRTSSGMQALLNEANVNLDIMLGRLKYGYADLLKGLLSDMQERLPKDMMIRVMGSDANMEFGATGEPMFITPTRHDIGGKMDLILMANSANSNRELEKQNAIMYTQLLFNPMAIQMGIVGPNEVYNGFKNILEKHGVLGIENYIKKPEGVQTPLSLYDEIAAVTQGLVPRIVWHDTHQAKIEGLKAYSQEEAFIVATNNPEGVNSNNAMEALNAAVGIHSMMLQAMNAQAAPANVSGLQISPTLGARAAGVVGETGRPLTQESVPQGQVPEGQAAGGAA